MTRAYMRDPYATEADPTPEGPLQRFVAPYYIRTFVPVGVAAMAHDYTSTLCMKPRTGTIDLAPCADSDTK